MPYITRQNKDASNSLLDAIAQDAYNQGVRNALQHFYRVTTWIQAIEMQKDPEEYTRKVLDWIKLEEAEVQEKFKGDLC